MALLCRFGGVTVGLCKSDVHKVEFVYESAKPHLRLSWQWVARADAGPVEHRICYRKSERTGDMASVDG